MNTLSILKAVSFAIIRSHVDVNHKQNGFYVVKPCSEHQAHLICALLGASGHVVETHSIAVLGNIGLYKTIENADVTVASHVEAYKLYLTKVAKT